MIEKKNADQLKKEILNSGKDKIKMRLKFFVPTKK